MIGYLFCLGVVVYIVSRHSKDKWDQIKTRHLMIKMQREQDRNYQLPVYLSTPSKLCALPGNCQAGSTDIKLCSSAALGGKYCA